MKRRALGKLYSKKNPKRFGIKSENLSCMPPQAWRYDSFKKKSFGRSHQICKKLGKKQKSGKKSKTST